MANISHITDHLLRIKKETIFDDNHDNERKLEQITTISYIFTKKKIVEVYTLRQEEANETHINIIMEKMCVYVVVDGRNSSEVRIFACQHQ